MKGLSVFVTSLIQGLIVASLAHLSLDGCGPQAYFAGVGGAYMLGALTGAYLAQSYWDNKAYQLRRKQARAWRTGRVEARRVLELEEG